MSPDIDGKTKESLPASLRRLLERLRNEYDVGSPEGEQVLAGFEDALNAFRTLYFSGNVSESGSSTADSPSTDTMPIRSKERVLSINPSDKRRESLLKDYLILAGLSAGSHRSIGITDLLGLIKAAGLKMDRASLTTKLNRLKKDLAYLQWFDPSDISATEAGLGYLKSIRDRRLNSQELEALTRVVDAFLVQLG